MGEGRNEPDDKPGWWAKEYQVPVWALIAGGLLLFIFGTANGPEDLSDELAAAESRAEAAEARVAEMEETLAEQDPQSDDASDTSDDPTDRPGVPSVYREIESETDCAELQEAFDQAMENAERYGAGDERRKAPLSYAAAADDRMEQVGCYE